MCQTPSCNTVPPMGIQLQSLFYLLVAFEIDEISYTTKKKRVFIISNGLGFFLFSHFFPWIRHL